jgi:hypothetical protein
VTECDRHDRGLESASLKLRLLLVAWWRTISMRCDAMRCDAMRYAPARAGPSRRACSWHLFRLLTAPEMFVASSPRDSQLRENHPVDQPG